MDNIIEKNEKVRNGGVELLRIICMFGFVCLHVIGYSSIAPFGSYEFESKFLLHLRYLLNVGVDVFAFISGFYGIKFTIRKALHLLYIGCFSSLCVFLIEIYFFNVEFKIVSLIQIFLSNWYFREYLILFFLSPFLSIIIENDDKKHINEIVIALLLLFLWNFLAAQLPSSFGQTGTLGNHSAMLLIMIYLLGRLLNITKILENLHTWILIVLVFICFPILFCFSKLKDFSSPFCIVSAICLFEIFRRLPISTIISRIACFISPSMLGILILHNAGSHKISGGLVYRYFENFSGNLPGMIFIKYSLIIFFFALVIDLLRRLIMFILRKIKDAIINARKS